ncbi:hypothetical protein [Haladaptatus halobius]|uniref:hypothetical protein n=1 Tax=Haladaptatus halobius TaxID=2884875 RepID=UPI0034A4E6BF
METVIGPRKELGIRTIFNILGPLTNPAGADAQVFGVYDPELVSIIAEPLTRLEIKRALVVHGSGLDEVAIHGETTVSEVTDDSIEEYTVSPQDVGLETHEIGAIAGGTPKRMQLISAGYSQEQSLVRSVILFSQTLARQYTLLALQKP